MSIMINANREAYGTDDIRQTLTVGQLIKWLEDVSDGNEDMPVYIGNDRKDYGWYTYGGITGYDIILKDGEEE